MRRTSIGRSSSLRPFQRATHGSHRRGGAWIAWIAVLVIGLVVAAFLLWKKPVAPASTSTTPPASNPVAGSASQAAPTAAVHHGVHFYRTMRFGRGIGDGAGFFIANNTFVTCRNRVARGDTVEAAMPNDHYLKLFHAIGSNAVDDIVLLHPHNVAFAFDSLELSDRDAVAGDKVRVPTQSLATPTVTLDVVAVHEWDSGEHLIELRGSVPTVSGAPLLDEAGKVVGMLVSESADTTFAVPAKIIAAIPHSTPKTINEVIGGDLSPAAESARYRIEGRLYRDQRAIDKAQVAYEQAIKANPKDWRAWYNAAFCYATFGRKDEALAARRQAAALTHKHPSMQAALAAACVGSGREDEAKSIIAELEKTLEPWRVDTWCEIGALHLSLHEIDAAAAIADRLAVDAPTDPSVTSLQARLKEVREKR